MKIVPYVLTYFSYTEDGSAIHTSFSKMQLIVNKSMGRLFILFCYEATGQKKNASYTDIVMLLCVLLNIGCISKCRSDYKCLSNNWASLWSPIIFCCEYTIKFLKFRIIDSYENTVTIIEVSQGGGLVQI